MSGDSIVVTRSLFQAGDGGAIPTSPHQFRVEQISKRQANACYRKWHYLGEQDFISTIHFGVKTEGELWGAISFGPPNATEIEEFFTRNSQEGWFEIKRLALSESLPKNSESHFIAISIRLLRKLYEVRGIITYADSAMGHTGIIYKASGFKYLGLTEPKNDYWIDGKIQQRGGTTGMGGEWKPRSRKHLFVKN